MLSIQPETKKLAKRLKLKHKPIKKALKFKQESLVLAAPACLASIIKSHQIDISSGELKILIYDAKHVEILDSGLWYETVSDIIGRPLKLSIDFIGRNMHENTDTILQNIAAIQYKNISVNVLRSQDELSSDYDLSLSFSFSESEVDSDYNKAVLNAAKQSKRHFLIGYDPESLHSSLLLHTYYGYSPTDTFFRNNYHLPKNKDSGLAWGSVYTEITSSQTNYSHLTNIWPPQETFNRLSALIQSLLSNKVSHHHTFCQTFEDKVYLMSSIWYHQEDDSFYYHDKKEVIFLASRQDLGITQPPNCKHSFEAHTYALVVLTLITIKQQQEKAA